MSAVAKARQAQSHTPQQVCTTEPPQTCPPGPIALHTLRRALVAVARQRQAIGCQTRCAERLHVYYGPCSMALTPQLDRIIPFPFQTRALPLFARPPAFHPPASTLPPRLLTILAPRMPRGPANSAPMP